MNTVLKNKKWEEEEEESDTKLTDNILKQDHNTERKEENAYFKWTI